MDFRGVFCLSVCQNNPVCVIMDVNPPSDPWVVFLAAAGAVSGSCSSCVSPTILAVLTDNTALDHHGLHKRETLEERTHPRQTTLLLP